MFRNTGANAFAKNQMRLAYEDKRDLYCISDLISVLQRLGEAKLIAKPSKCMIGHAKVQYLGHLVGAGELHPTYVQS